MASPDEDQGLFDLSNDLNEGAGSDSDVEGNGNGEVANSEDADKSKESGDGKAFGKGGKGKGRGGRGSTGQTAPSEAGSTATTKKAPNRDLAGVKKANKQFTRRCKGCGLYFKPEAMGSKSAFCLRDKHRLDCLTRVAKAQGKLSWIAEVRKDEDKVKKVLKRYDELTGGSGLLKSQARKVRTVLSISVCLYFVCVVLHYLF